MEKNQFTHKKKLIAIFFFIITFLQLIFSTIFSLITINNTNILYGISINKINIAGMTKEESILRITKLIENKKNNDITIFISDDIQKKINFDSLDINYDISSCINEAYNIGRLDNIFENNFDILNLLLNKKNINITIEYNEEKINELISDLSLNLPNRIIRK